VQDQTVIVHLHATAPTAACPQCGTAGSRIHSRYQRTIADVAFGRRCLVLKLLVRKWVCPLASCPQRIFAEHFRELVQRYARMTDRLMKAFQSVGVTTNGADAAQILSSLGALSDPLAKEPVLDACLLEAVRQCFFEKRTSKEHDMLNSIETARLILRPWHVDVSLIP
jgi:hypothetical protein